MGKNSLIKSTSKKKAAGTKAEEKGKKKSAKTNPKARSKAAAEAKPAGGKAPENKAPEQAPAPKPSLKELIFKQFQWKHAEPVVKPDPPASDLRDAPQLTASEDPGESDRLRVLLHRSFDMEDIRSAAVPPPAAPVEAEPPAEAPPVSEEPAAARTPEIAPEPAELPPAEPVEASPVEPAEPPPMEPAGTRETDDQPPPKIDYLPPESSGSGSDPVQRALKLAIAAAIVIVLLIIGTSWKNSARYYIIPKKNAIEIWRGRFSPTGKRFVMTLPETKAAVTGKEVYSHQEIYPLIFNYYLNQADKLVDAKGLPDYDRIRERLGQAARYAVTPEMKDAVHIRLNNIERMALLYKVDVALSRGTADDLKTALDLLGQAEPLAAAPVDKDLILRKKAEAQERLKALEAKPAG